MADVADSGHKKRPQEHEEPGRTGKVGRQEARLLTAMADEAGFGSMHSYKKRKCLVDCIWERYGLGSVRSEVRDQSAGWSYRPSLVQEHGFENFHESLPALFLSRKPSYLLDNLPFKQYSIHRKQQTSAHHNLLLTNTLCTRCIVAMLPLGMVPGDGQHLAMADAVEVRHLLHPLATSVSEDVDTVVVLKEWRACSAV